MYTKEHRLVETQNNQRGIFFSGSEAKAWEPEIRSNPLAHFGEPIFS